ncbi:MarR family winged helix-turn-helix transcriptional regulator [Demequina sp. SO4-13]|uniref:MarR family winged helix-turn-helix transcriptional regulator n=1 Tax=Demequina sp. SO4-13 TaxID=3401027 RepID=UPI003AF754DB
MADEAEGRGALEQRIVALQGELMRAQMRSQAEALIDQHLTLAQFRAIIFIHAYPGRPTSDVGAFVGVRPNIATGVVQRLVDRGWVERTRHPDDGRVRLLSPTAEGKAFVDAIVAQVERDFLDSISQLSTEQLHQLEGILESLSRPQRGVSPGGAPIAD